jgi:signal transduction histidine kinase
VDNARDQTVNVALQFAQLVSLACHDLRTPLATASGFARTLQRLDDLEPPADRYVEMIGAATDQLAELLDFLSIAARIQDERFEPQLRAVNMREVAELAAARIEDGRASVEGDGGAEVRADHNWGAVALASMAEAARRHGGLDRITLTVSGAEVAIGPIVDSGGTVAIGEELLDFSAAVGTLVLRTSGATVELADDALRVRFPSPSAGDGTAAGP